MLRNAGHALEAELYATGAADPQRSFVHVDNLAGLCMQALKCSPTSKLHHAGAEPSLRTKDIAEAVSYGLGQMGKTTEPDQPASSEALRAPPLTYCWASNFQSRYNEQLLGKHPASSYLKAYTLLPPGK